MNRVLIDTDILSYYFKGDDTVVGNFKKYLQHYDLIEISLITFYEIERWFIGEKCIKTVKYF